jgi:hypothetical protein
MISYKNIIDYLIDYKHNYSYSIKSSYIVINNGKYHITIYQDQWDDYENANGKPYHLFHISLNDINNRCSSYFWVNKSNYHIRKIPTKYFMYNQPTYSFFSSTRSPCKLSEIISTIKLFQKIINDIKQ